MDTKDLSFHYVFIEYQVSEAVTEIFIDQPRGLTRSWVRFPAIPWGFSLWGEDPRGDHDLGS
jgi:hypothetical protein